MFKTIIDGGTAFLKIVIALEKSIGLLNIALAVTGGLLGAKLVPVFSLTIAKLLAVTTAIGGSTVAITAMNVAIGGGLIIGLLAAIKIYDHFNVTLEENKTLLEENTSEMDKLEKQVKKLTESEEELSKQDELRLKSSQLKIDLLKVEQKELEKLIATQEAQAIAFRSGGSQFLGMDEGSIDQLKLMQNQLQEFNDIQDGAKEVTEKYALELETGLIANLEELNGIFAVLDDEALISIFGKERFNELEDYRDGLTKAVGVVTDVDEAMRRWNDAVYGNTEVQEESQESTDRSIEELSRLAELYPLATQSMIEDEIALTEEKIKNTELRILSMELEMQALDRLIQANVVAGGSFYVPEALTRDYTSDVLAIEGLRERLEGLTSVQEKHFGTTKKGKTETINLMDAYENLFNKLEDIQHQSAITSEELSRATGIDQIPILEKQIGLFENQQTALHNIAQAMRETRKEYEESDLEYRELTEAIQQQQIAWQGLESDIFSSEQTIIDIRKEIQDLADKDLEDLKDKLEANADVIADKLNEALSDEIDLLKEQKDAVEERYDAEIDLANEAIDLQKDKNDALQDEKDLQEALWDVENKRLKLSNIQAEQNVLLFTGEGVTGFELVADPREVFQAEQDLAQSEKSLEELRVQQKQDAEIDKLEAKVAELEAEKEAELAFYDTQIENLQNQQELIQENIKAGNEIQQKLLDEIISIVETSELDSYDTRLGNLQDFVDNYNAKIAQLKALPSGTGGGGTSVISAAEAGGVRSLEEIIARDVASFDVGAEGGIMPSDGLIMAHKGELMGRPDQFMNLVQNLMTTPPKLNNTGGNQGTTIQSLTVELPNVENANQFAKELPSALNINTFKSINRTRSGK